MKFDLHRLELLSELAHRGTVTAVAEALSYSPSAVSQQLAVLEKEVGTPLLVPDGRRLRLTPQAEILVAHTTAVLAQLEQAEAQVASSLGEIVDTVRLASIQTAALTLIPVALANLARQHPGLRVELYQAEPEVALPGLHARQFDLVLDETYPGVLAPRAHEAHSEEINVEAMRVSFAAGTVLNTRDGAPLAETCDDLRLADFATQHWVMEPPGNPAREWATAACRRAGFEPDVVHATSDMLVQAALVGAGLAVAFLPDLMWLEHPPTFEVRQLSRNDQRQVHTTCRTGAREHPAIIAVRSALKDAFVGQRA